MPTFQPWNELIRQRYELDEDEADADYLTTEEIIEMLQKAQAEGRDEVDLDTEI